MEKSEGNTLINTRWLITNEKNIYISFTKTMPLDFIYIKKEERKLSRRRELYSRNASFSLVAVKPIEF